MAVPTPYLDVLNQAFAEELAKQPPIEDLSTEQFRALLETLQAHTPDPSVTRTSFTVPFEGGVRTFVFKPANTPKGAILPAIFYLHGGAWIAGTVNSFDGILRDLSKQTGCAVVFPSYTLAPEARFPTQQEECYAVVKWVREHGRTKGLRQDGFAIVGDSAGGQLTVATSILCSTRKPLIPIAHQTLLHPILNTNLSDRPTISEFEFFNGPFLTVPFIRVSIEQYIPEEKERDSETASPLLITLRNAKKQPRTLIVNSSADILRDDGLLFGQILQRAGVECANFTTHGQLHDSEVIEATRGSETPRVVVRMVAGEIRGAIVGGVGKGENGHGIGIEIGGEEGEKVQAQKDARTKKKRKTRTS